jgi:hypothetical protein
MRTNENPFWVRDFVANYRYRWLAANRSGNAERAVVFSPHLSRREVL